MSTYKPAVVIVFDTNDEVERVMFFHDHNDAVSTCFDTGLKRYVLSVVEIYQPGELPKDLPFKQQTLPMEPMETADDAQD